MENRAPAPLPERSTETLTPTTTVGICRYCGQVLTVEVTHEDIMSGRLPDELALEACECFDAKHWRGKRDTLERANARIDMLFVDSEKLGISPATEAQIEILRRLAADMVEDHLQSVTLSLSEEIKCKFAYTAKGTLEIKRTDTTSKKMEV